MSHKSLKEKLLAARFRELGVLREDQLPNRAPESLQAQVFESINQMDAAGYVNVDELLNVGSASHTADFLHEVVEPESTRDGEK